VETVDNTETYEIVLWPASDIEDKYVAGYFNDLEEAQIILDEMLYAAKEHNLDTQGTVRICRVT
jgi:hypothetical protein